MRPQLHARKLTSYIPTWAIGAISFLHVLFDPSRAYGPISRMEVARCRLPVVSHEQEAVQTEPGRSICLSGFWTRAMHGEEQEHTKAIGEPCTKRNEEGTRDTLMNDGA